MPAFTAKDVQALRQSTGVGMLDAKRALEQNEGNIEEATQWLRVQGLASAAKRADREASQGVVALGSAGANASIVQLRSETDFVAKNEDFIAIAQRIADAVAANGASAIDAFKEEIETLLTTLKENISIGRVEQVLGGDGIVIAPYLHLQSGRGVNGVLVALRGADADLAHEIAVHAAFTKPAYLSRDEVPAADVDKERATIEEISRGEGKPEASLPKILEGRLNGWFKERCLLEQPYVRDEKQTIAQLLGDASIVQFAQVIIGA
ncbi:MAG: translation elongation factor Ts [Actinobacteria bacterium]|nr:translation elongation factor Ts [Actinomycetota bacterium]